MVEMTEVLKDMCAITAADSLGFRWCLCWTHENFNLWYELHPAATGGDDWGGEGYANGTEDWNFVLPIYLLGDRYENIYLWYDLYPAADVRDDWGGDEWGGEGYAPVVMGGAL